MNGLKNEYIFKVKGMRCASCVGKVEDFIIKIPGIESVNVNLPAEKVGVRSALNFDVDLKNKIFAAVVESGYTPEDIVTKNSNIQKTLIQNIFTNDFLKLITSAVLSFPLLLPMFGVHISGITQLLLATPIQFLIGFEFYKSSYYAIKTKYLNMDVLVAIGTSAAYFLSLYLLFSNTSGHFYFESSAVVITLVLLGKFLEKRAKLKTLKALESLESLKPSRALVFNSKTQNFEDRSTEMIFQDDIVMVRPSERIPVDGIIIEGQAQVDESFLTGESLPVFKSIDHKVLCGSLNTDGILKIKVTAATQDATLLHQIIQSVESAQMTKAPIQKMVDQISRIFVPAVLLIALLTFLGWYFYSSNFELSLMNAVSVLVIACPCALGLATPTTMMVGTGLAAQRGILIKDMESFELVHKIKTIAFDKTGTLTQGKPQVISTIFDSELSVSDADSKLKLKIDILKKAASLQKNIHHPLALAVVEHFEKMKNNLLELYPVSELKSIPGLGVEGIIENERWILGSKKLLESYQVNWQDDNQFILKNQDFGISSTAYLARVSTTLGIVKVSVECIFLFQDQLKPQSLIAINKLKSLSIKPVLITGDNRKTAALICEQLGIKDFFAEVLPHDKMKYVKQLKIDAQGSIIAMVGDGVNDALALTTADVGIAMGSGTDVAMHSAGITLLSGDPLAIIDAIELSKKTSDKIKQSLFWAFIYNVLGVPLAAFGILNPILAGGAMALSSVSVVLNALSLKLK